MHDMRTIRTVFVHHLWEAVRPAGADPDATMLDAAAAAPIPGAGAAARQYRRGWGAGQPSRRPARPYALGRGRAHQAGRSLMSGSLMARMSSAMDLQQALLARPAMNMLSPAQRVAAMSAAGAADPAALLPGEGFFKSIPAPPRRGGGLVSLCGGSRFPPYMYRVCILDVSNRNTCAIHPRYVSRREHNRNTCAIRAIHRAQNA